jgi:CDP-paratose 2-epimerase
MKILITGGAGMVGSHCAEYFSSKGDNVLIYDNLERSNIFGYNKDSVEYNWKYLGTIKGIERIKADVRDIVSLEDTFNSFRPDVVIHTAGQPGVQMSLEKPAEDYHINATGTLNVLEALRKTNDKGIFLYCSTNKVYGVNVDQYTLDESVNRYSFRDISGVNETESIDRTGHTPYGVSKLSGDLYVQDYAYAYGMRTGVFRMSCIYGTRQFGFEDQGWIAWFCRRFFTEEPITLYGNGKQVRDVLWVGDLVKAFDLFINSQCQHEVFNIGGGPDNSLSLLELIKILQIKTGKSAEVKTSEWRKFDQKVYISDIQKVCKTLDWKPTVSPSEGVGRMVDWVEKNSSIFV